MRTLRLLLPALVAAAACGHSNIANQGASVVPSSSVYLRNTFDTDPSIYIGRFIASGVTDLDESNTMALACSRHITSRFIDGGGVNYSEELHVSTQVALKLGIPVIASGSAKYDDHKTAQANYRLTGKLVAEIADPEAFARCCKDQPDQCTDRFIGEFIQGTGTLLHQRGRAAGVQAEGTHPGTGIQGEGGVDRSAEWKRLAEFEEPVYFAFKINPTPYNQAAVDTCPEWVNNPPKVAGGILVVGRADGARSEQAARNQAIRDATIMAHRAAGVFAEIPLAIRADSWCTTTTKNGRGQLRHAARVLAFVSDPDIAEARAAAAREAERERELEDREFEQGPAPTTTPTTPTTTPTAPESSASGDLQRIIQAVDGASFSADKLGALASSIRGASLSAAEARAVVDRFSFSADRVQAAAYLREVVSDPQNWHLVVEAFISSSDREKVREMAP